MSTEADTTADATEETTDHSDLLEQEGDIAADYLEELLDIADLDGDLDIDVEGDRAAVSIVGAELSQLCLLYTSPSPRDQRGSRMPSSA